MKRLILLVIIITFSCKSSKKRFNKSYKSPIEFVEQLQKSNDLGENPLVFLKGSEIGFYKEVKKDSSFVNAWFQYEAYFSKNSKFTDSLIGKKASDGIVMIDRSESYHEYPGQVEKIYVQDGKLITREDFRKIENKQIKSLSIMTEIELIKDKFYEILVIHLIEKNI